MTPDHEQTPESETPPPRSGVSFRALSEAQAGVFASNADVRRMLNTLGMAAPMVNALIQHPGAKGEYATLVQSAQAMLREANTASRFLIDELGMGRADWAQYKMLRLMTSAVADRWRTTAREDGTPTPSIANLLPVWVALAHESTPDPAYDDPPDDDAIAGAIALLDAMRPVMGAIDRFDLFHDPAEAAKQAKDLIVSASTQALHMLLPEGAADRSRRQLHQALLRNAGNIYASSWRKLSEQVVSDLKSLPPAEQEARVRNHPGGFPLTQVNDGFAASFSQLVDILMTKARPEPAPAADGEMRG
jgi:hypothetical protein